ncbi:DUF937 domain-containing protein [Hyphobacterium sp.]|uniref:DUF937 domain-containing protein n=1 Tax=Hyphobacterium sp. TaxID=2004662 RepID=UPI003BAA8828
MSGLDIGSLLEAVSSSQGRAPIENAASGLGLSGDQTQSAIQALLPALAAGLSREEGGGNANNLISTILNAGQSRDLEDLGDPVETGNSILGQVFGNRDVSRAVAADAAAQSGIGEEALKRLLPVIAASLVSQLAGRQEQQNSGAGGLVGGLLGALGNPQNSSGGDLAGLAGSFLGGGRSQQADQPGISDDVLRMIMNR